MTKQKYIEKYGIEGWERKLLASRRWNKLNKQRHNDASRKWKVENAERYKIYSQQWNKDNSALHMELSKTTYRAYCKKDEYELIENYELAKADNFEGWHCHHRLELHTDFSLRYTVSSLKKLDLYYNRPASELIFLTQAEHSRRHRIARWINE